MSIANSENWLNIAIMVTGSNMRNWLKLGGLTGISRILGLIRDIVCANIFGASLEFDAFLVAFQIPNFMRRLFAEGALTQAFVPIYNELPPEKQKIFSGIVLGLIILVTGLLVALAILSGKSLIYLYAPGFNKNNQLSLAIDLLKWTMPYIAAISIVTLCSGILNSNRKFMLTGAIPCILNICLILASTQNNILLLAKAVFVAGFLQASFMLYSTWHLIGKICLKIKNSHIKQLLRLILLGSTAAMLGQLSAMLDIFLASWLELGSVSWLYYAQRLVLLPVGIIAVAIATVSLPELTKIANNPEKLHKQLNHSLKTIWHLSWPACFGLMLLSHKLVNLFFQHGAFSHHSAIITSNIIVVLSLGIPAFMLNKVLLAACYAQKRMEIPIKILSYSLIINITIGAIAMLYLDQIGIALASVSSAWFQTFYFCKQFELNFADKIIPALGLAMAIILAKLTPLFQNINNSLYIVCIMLLGIVIYELGLRCFDKSLLRIMHD